MEEAIKKILKNDEKVLWKGRPETVKLLGTLGSGGIVMKWILSAVLGIVLTVAYILYTGGESSAEFSPIMLVFTLGIPLAICLGPINDFRKLKKKVIYIITDQRVITYLGEDSSYSMGYDAVDSVKVKRAGKGIGTLFVGTPSFKLKDSKIRYTALHGVSENLEGETRITGMILYNISAADKVSEMFADKAVILPSM